MRKMFVFLALLFLYTGSSVAKKPRQFSNFTACLDKNQTIRLECSYHVCQDTTPYTCEFLESDGTLMAKRSYPPCYHNVPLNLSHQVNYSCKLTRKERVEEKQIVVDYIPVKGKKRKILACPATTGLQLHGAPSFLLPVVSLTLWRILASDSQTT